jgi:hypothetical protein
MKVLFAALALLVLPAVATAEDLTKYVELLRSDLRTSKTELLTEALSLTADQGTKFWPIQREYETELAKIGDSRLQLLKDYAASYNTLTPENAKSLVDRSFKLESSRMNLLKKYTGKVSKEVSPMVAARFAQTEAFVNSLVDLKIRAETPLAPGK